MRTVYDAPELRAATGAWRRAGERIGFVPTMGALHEGHLSLVRRCREVADRVVVSVFVNPTQFGSGEDLDEYPRDPEGDARLLAREGCDLLFLPEVETIYPEGHSTDVVPRGAAEGLEGKLRPGHFAGVATVVTQLFNLVLPEVAVFGEKDAQQLSVVRQLVRDLHFPVEIVAGPTVREDDGLALSSRNAYLDDRERRAATVLHRALEAGRALVAEGERRAEAVRTRIAEVLATEPLAETEYVAVVDAETFRPVAAIEGSIVCPIAVRIGTTRLIDNARIHVAAGGE